MNEYPDNELVNLVCEKSEEASDVLYEKYSFIIELVCNKYRKKCRNLGIDYNELKQEAMLGFSDALLHYNQDEDASLATFIYLCVERKVIKYVKALGAKKNTAFRTAYSLDALIYDDKTALKDIIGDDSNDPQVTLEKLEDLKDLKQQIDEILSPAEKEVYVLIINSVPYDDMATVLNKDIKYIYNTSARIRAKIRSIIDEK